MNGITPIASGSRQVLAGRFDDVGMAAVGKARLKQSMQKKTENRANAFGKHEAGHARRCDACKAVPPARRSAMMPEPMRPPWAGRLGRGSLAASRFSTSDTGDHGGADNSCA
jgi:hypothetical protein